MTVHRCWIKISNYLEIMYNKARVNGMTIMLVGIEKGRSSKSSRPLL